MWTRKARLAAACFLCVTSSCGPTADDAATESPASLDSALTRYPNSTYYLVAGPDLRRCVYPLCGGFFVKRVNHATTICSDGTAQTQCRILEFDYRALGLEPAAQDTLQQLGAKGQVLLRGQIRKTLPIAGNTYDKFVAAEAWQARGLTPPGGTFSRVRERTRACPGCPSLQSEPLNQAGTPRLYFGLLFDPARFPTPLVTVLQSLVEHADAGILVAGTPGSSSGQTPLKVSEAYTPFPSMRQGLVGELCGSRGLPYTCEAETFCRYERSDLCGRADAAGACAVRPAVCPALYRPVCGCDARTYSSECRANGVGVSVDYDGVCH